MKKIVSAFLSLLMVLTILAVPTQTAYAADATISVSKSAIDIGDSVTVTVGVPEGVTATIDVTYPGDLVEFTKCSATANNSGSAVSMNLGSFSSRTATITFKAKAAGTATFTVTPIKAGSDETGEEVGLGGASTSVTIANQTSIENPTTLSSNNSLGSLQISPGTLSPAFQPDTTNYKATVSYDVTKVAVSAVTADATAKITSLSGGSSLQVGENTIKIVVQAENGVSKTYTIVVTRQEKVNTGNSEEEEPSSEATVSNVFNWNGSKLGFVEKIPEDVIPVDFTASTLMMSNKEVPVLNFKDGDLTVMYLSNESGENSLYVYDKQNQDVYPFVKLGTDDLYVIVLRPDDASAPSGYISCTLSIEGKGVVNAYQFNAEELLGQTEKSSLFGAEVFYAAEATASDFYLIYCVNNAGEYGWYQYDSVEGTFQRYSAALFTANATSDPELQGDYNRVVLELQSARQVQITIIVVAAVIAVVLLIIIIVLAVKLGKHDVDEELYDEELYDEEFYDEEEDDDEEVEIEFYEMPVEESLAEEDEIEIEFYEMPKEFEGEIATSLDEEDDDDLQFIDFE